MKWIIGLVVVAALGWFGFQYMEKNAAVEAQNLAEAASKKAEEAATAARTTAEEALTKAQDSMPAGIDLGSITGGLDGILSSTTEAFSGITDVDSATAALPTLQDASSKLSGLSDTIARLPDAAQGPIGNIVGSGLSSLEPIIEKVNAIPGVGPLVEPIVTPMLEMLKGLAG